MSKRALALKISLVVSTVLFGFSTTAVSIAKKTEIKFLHH